MKQISIKDSEILARAILENWREYDNYNNMYGCRFCDSASHEYYTKIVHDLDCPVLIARDILNDKGGINAL